MAGTVLGDHGEQSWATHSGRVWLATLTEARHMALTSFATEHGSAPTPSGASACAGGSVLVRLAAVLDGATMAPTLQAVLLGKHGAVHRYSVADGSWFSETLPVANVVHVDLVHGPTLLASGPSGLCCAGSVLVRWRSGRRLSAAASFTPSGAVRIIVLASVADEEENEALVLYVVQLEPTGAAVQQMSPRALAGLAGALAAERATDVQLVHLVSAAGDGAPPAAVSAYATATHVTFREVTGATRRHALPSAPLELVCDESTGALAAVRCRSGWWLAASNQAMPLDPSATVLVHDWRLLGSASAAFVGRVREDGRLTLRDILPAQAAAAADANAAPHASLTVLPPVAVSRVLASAVLQHGGHVRALQRRLAGDERMAARVRDEVLRAVGAHGSDEERGAAPNAALTPILTASVRWHVTAPRTPPAAAAVATASNRFGLDDLAAMRWASRVWLAARLPPSVLAASRDYMWTAQASADDDAPVAVDCALQGDTVFAWCALPPAADTVAVRLVAVADVSARLQLHSDWLSLPLRCLPMQRGARPPCWAAVAIASMRLEAPALAHSCWDVLSLRPAGPGRQASSSDGALLVETDARTEGLLHVLAAARPADIHAAVEKLARAKVKALFLQAAARAQDRTATAARTLIREIGAEQSRAGHAVRATLQQATDSAMIYAMTTLT